MIKVLDRAPNYGDTALWIRKVYMAGFKDRSITTVVRPGDRSKPGTQGHFPSDVDLPVRYIRGVGEAKVGAPGNLFPDDGTTVSRTDCIVKKIGELTNEDLRGMVPDTATPELVLYHLATLYNSALPSLDDVVTIWRFEYRPNASA